MKTNGTQRWCPQCALWLDTKQFKLYLPSKTYDSYCRDCRKAYRKQQWQQKRSPNAKRYREREVIDTTPKLDADTLALVSSDPIWQTWLACPPRTELDLQHMYAVQLQRKYRCCYKRLSHSMRAAWCDEWEAKLGHAPYAWEKAG
jgi:hypothetical protein